MSINNIDFRSEAAFRIVVLDSLVPNGPLSVHQHVTAFDLGSEVNFVELVEDRGDGLKHGEGRADGVELLCVRNEF